MLGTIVNALAILVGGIIGLLFRKGIARRYEEILMQGLGLSVVLIGAKGALQTNNILLVILCVAGGSIIGEWIEIEAQLARLGHAIEQRLVAGRQSGDSSFARGFVSASLLYCVGSMAIVGSLESGLSGNHQTLFAKSVIDGISSILLASTLGMGVLASSVTIFIYQGAITLSATLLKPLLHPAVISEMNAVGGLLIAAIGLQLLGILNIRVGNMLPAIALPLLVHLLRSLFV